MTDVARTDQRNAMLSDLINHRLQMGDEQWAAYVMTALSALPPKEIAMMVAYAIQYIVDLD